MKLRKLNDLILECDKENPYEKNTWEHALFARCSQLLVSETIDSIEEFVRVVKTDLYDIECSANGT